MRGIPPGKVLIYQIIAARVGRHSAAWAVGHALHKNINTKNIPCHRVVRLNGQVGGYAFGHDKKVKILKSKGIEIKNGAIINFSAVLYN